VIGIAKGEVIYDGPTSGLTDTVLDRVYRFDRASRANSAFANAQS
jgi:ABC-type phosphate/phosphonate transport system ATPase subunit